MEAKWKNPCGWATDSDTSNATLVKAAINKLIKATKDIIDLCSLSKDYLDKFAKQKAALNFDTAIQDTIVLPSPLKHDYYAVPVRTYGEHLSTEAADNAISNQLPAMYKYLELLTGAMDAIASNSQSDDPLLAGYLKSTVTKMLALLCEFSGLLEVRGLKKLPSVEREDLPERHQGNEVDGGLDDFLVFREALIFFDILDVVFARMAEDYA